MGKLKPMKNSCASMSSALVCDSTAAVVVPGRTNNQGLERTKLLKCSSISARDGQPIKNEQKSVVQMKVSLHCQGCVLKLRKHIWTMEGVTACRIDLEEKKVTVVGYVSPHAVLESISRVKRAEMWPS